MIRLTPDTVRRVVTVLARRPIVDNWTSDDFESKYMLQALVVATSHLMLTMR